ncbi:TetR/AcrR family transcriptional regulator [Jiulongibacter sp. NS-SX5]|uniref:TetR/AcrR family transcriptional regulator n=1 Tax=Jiulongibacter sp. NS-SX5 TaxID=3463854 RepID=UPI0040599860
MSPRSKAEFEEIRNTRKQEILDAALKLFAEKGFTSTSISMIAKETGISKGLMYNYFESKDQLLEGIINAAVKEMDTIYASVYTEPDPRILLSKMLDITVEYLIKKKEFQTLLMSLALQKSSHEMIHKLIKGKTEQMVGFMSNILNQLGHHSEDEVYMFGAIMDGMAIQFLVTEDEQLLHKTAEAIRKKYLD